eukprot:GFKZ01004951.1.p1 GENE.GFKZ01004951.1~~GFKZ01004951.1.p1  ORF type:complete len:544 (-),score=65.67 GFKZ01004951.1:1304-2935(-)
MLSALLPRIFFFFLFPLLLYPSSTAQRPPLPCPFPLQPPYHHFAIVSLTLTKKSQLNQTYHLLSHPCPLEIISGDQLNLNQPNLLAVDPNQLSLILTTPFLQPYATILSRNLSHILSISPSQRSNYQPPPSLRQSTPTLNRSFYSQYWDHPALQTKWQTIPRHHPLVNLTIIGSSINRNPIHAFTIGRTNSTSPRRILLTALQHAREWIATHVATYIADALAIHLATHSNDDPLFRLLHSTQIILIPLINPDGYRFTRIHRLQRKNRRVSGCPNRIRDGVDLNRNWATGWGPVSNSATDPNDPCDEQYIGAAPFSEPEADVVRSYIESLDGIESHIDFHSYGAEVLSPWSFTEDTPDRWAEVCNLGSFIARDMSRAFGQQYLFKQASSNYLAGGVLSDWMASRGALSYTVELRPQSTVASPDGFLLAEEEIEPTCHEGLEAVKTLLRYDGMIEAFTNCPRMESEEAGEEFKQRLDLPFVLVVSLGGALFVVLVLLTVVVVRRRGRKRLERGDIEGGCSDSEVTSSDGKADSGVCDGECDPPSG